MIIYMYTCITVHIPCHDYRKVPQTLGLDIAQNGIWVYPLGGHSVLKCTEKRGSQKADPSGQDRGRSVLKHAKKQGFQKPTLFWRPTADNMSNSLKSTNLIICQCLFKKLIFFTITRNIYMSS